MGKLNWRPAYSHMHAIAPEPTNLTGHDADRAYNKLKYYLGLNSYKWSPAAGIDKERRELFYRNGFHHNVRWMPKLSKGWRRLSYMEFCRFYGISI